MTRIVHLNGEWLPEAEARVSIFDRGFIMGDAVYEVTGVLGGKLIDFAGHCARLARSLEELDIPNPHDDATWLALHHQIIARNGLDNGMIYLQVSRGNAGDRDFGWPDPPLKPTVVMFTQVKADIAANPQAERGMRVITLPDLRWQRRDIKTVQLLYPAMAKMAAKAAGKDDAWLAEDGFITEGSSNNAWIVKGSRLITRQTGPEILHGITRAAVLRLAAEAQLTVEERPFTLEEAKAADEAFVTSASAFVMPVVEIDDIPIAKGQPGPISRRLRELYIEEMCRAAI